MFFIIFAPMIGFRGRCQGIGFRNLTCLTRLTCLINCKNNIKHYFLTPLNQIAPLFLGEREWERR